MKKGVTLPLKFTTINRFIVTFLASLVVTIPLYASPVDLLYKTPIGIGLEWKTYSLPRGEKITLYGAKRRRFITDNWYWGEAGYGALSGRRSGYLEGGVMTGFWQPLGNNMAGESRVFVGAGGGGAAPQGGGFIVHGTLGVHRAIMDGTYVGAELGYIKFLNGDIESVTIAVAVTRFFWEVLVK